MNRSEELDKLISEICNEAIESRWNEIAETLKKSLSGRIYTVGSYNLDRIINRASSNAMADACKRHLETTFAADMDEIARDKAEKEVRRRRKQRGLDPEPINLKMEGIE